MNSRILHIVIRSVIHYRRTLFYQFIIIALLSAVITGSLLTGYSVRKSLRTSAVERLGKTGYVISSGLRYFNPSLAGRFSGVTGAKTTTVLETECTCRNFSEGIRSLKASIYGIDSSFFGFHGADNLHLLPGEVAINSTLANQLKLKKGDGIILKINQLSDIPPGSPFAPSSTAGGQGVYKVGIILSPDSIGNFSLGINQLSPRNVFINRSDLISAGEKPYKANRILIAKSFDPSGISINEYLKRSLLPEDVGLTIRRSLKTDEPEIVSSRIFIDGEALNAILKIIPEGHPVITYLANSIEKGDKSTPYSFIAAIDETNYPFADNARSVVISKWLAEDLGALENDTLTVRWFSPGKISELDEISGKFVVKRIVSREGTWADSSLMPEFPGISGQESCSEWDAGVEIKTDRIRDKDEEYWNDFRGTPKAFIGYITGREIWGNNFGPATALRFPSSFSTDQIASSLEGKLDPDLFGLTVRDIYAEMISAADTGVDFGTLFLSLGFFIIVSCLILLLLAASTLFDSRKVQVSAYFAIGFSNSLIRFILFAEAVFTAVGGSLAGIAAGMMVNTGIVSALNSVWAGAVQTDTIDSFTGIIPLMTGFLVTTVVSVVFLYFLINRYLKRLREPETGSLEKPSAKSNMAILVCAASVTVVLTISGLSSRLNSTILLFLAGIFLFISMILLWRQYTLKGFRFRKPATHKQTDLSGKYYEVNSYNALMPVLLIAAGLFAVIITGFNRLEITGNSLSRKGGTGGYALWIETTLPVKDDLNSDRGRKNIGIDDINAEDLSFVGARRASGDDASCLNLNHVTSPPLLGIDPSDFIEKNAFSFSSLADNIDKADPWSALSNRTSENTIYGFADQTVLQWGLKKKTGDTLQFRSESGQKLNVVIAGGLNSSVFQGYILIGETNFSRFYPSISGASLFLADCSSESVQIYAQELGDRLEPFGADIQLARDRLASFFAVTNTYLSVFTVLGGLGLIIGVLGLGFVLRRNYLLRRKEFAVMMATGYSINKIREIILREQMLILSAGIATGLFPAVISTLSSIGKVKDIPLVSIAFVIAAMLITGYTVLRISLSGIRDESLLGSLRKE